MDKYKENTIRLTKMHDAMWVKAIAELKVLECDNKNKDYSVTYKKESHYKDRKFHFDRVQYVEETRCFIFTRFRRDHMDSSVILDTIDSSETLMDIEIITYEIEDKVNLSDFSIWN